MASLLFNGNLAGRKISDTSSNVSIEACLGRDVIIKLDDNIGNSAFKYLNSNDEEVGYVKSSGEASFLVLQATFTYTAAPWAGQIAAENTHLNSALDTLFSCRHSEWNELSPQIPDSAKLTFETVGRKTFLAGKLMVFKGGIKQKPGDDYLENSNRYSVTFYDAPRDGLNIEFTYIKG